MIFLIFCIVHVPTPTCDQWSAKVSTNMRKPVGSILSDLLSTGKCLNLKNRSKIQIQDMTGVNQIQLKISNRKFEKRSLFTQP